MLQGVLVDVSVQRCEELRGGVPYLAGWIGVSWFKKGDQRVF